MQPPNASQNARSIDLGILSLMVVAGIWLRLYWGFSDDSIFHPDAIYQVLEPAHKLVYGFGLQAWEWEVGARNWALPGLLGGVLGAARLLGFDQPEAYLKVMRVFVATTFCASAYPIYMLSRQYRASRLLSLVAAALFLFNPAMVALGYRTLSEVITTPFVLFGLMWALGAGGLGSAAQPEKRARLWFVLGVSLLGIAVLFRLQNALFALAVVLPWRFQPAQSERYALGLRTLVVWALIFGVLDWITWGLPFASAGAYIRFNLLLGGSTEFLGANPALYYVALFYRSMGPAGMLLLALPFLAFSRARLLFFCAFLYLGAHSFFPHKELRFVITVVPILAVLSAVGLQVLIARVRAPRWRTGLNLGASAALFALAGAGIWGVSGLKMKDMGAPDLLHTTAETSVFDHLGGLNRLLIKASARADICGLYTPEHHAVETAGYTYFHREVPFFHPKNTPKNRLNYNYVITAKTPQPGWVLVDADHAFVLYKTQPQACAPVANYEALLGVPERSE